MDQSTMNDMASMTGMNIVSTATASSSAAAASVTGGMDMGGMGMGGDSCKISMLWNWYTVDACFLSSNWHITSSGMFAGSCIGVILLVMVLESLRRAAKEYDRYLVRSRINANPPALTSEASASDSDLNNNKNGTARDGPAPARPTSFRPTLLEQLIRALLHMLQFAVAYIIMLLAMYFNGYIIICIFIGAFLGAFVFNWTSIGLGGDEREITFCCG